MDIIGRKYGDALVQRGTSWYKYTGGNMDIKNIKINEITPYKNNAKMHDKTQIENVATSIKKYGFKQPLVIDSDGVIIVGHCRYEASKKLGLKTVPCVIADDLTEEQIKEFRIIDNKTNESDWDLDLLGEDIADLDFSDFDLEFGLDLLQQEECEIIEDEPPAVDEEQEPTAKLGDIWQLGRHRLMCGDSTDKETVERLMGGVW